MLLPWKCTTPLLMCFRKCSLISFNFVASSVNVKPSLLTDKEITTTPKTIDAIKFAQSHRMEATNKGTKETEKPMHQASKLWVSQRCAVMFFFCQSKKLKCFHSSGVVFLMTSSYQSCDLGSRSGDSNVWMIWIQSFMSISIAMLLFSLQSCSSSSSPSSSSSSSTFINNIVFVFFITFFIIKSLSCCSQNHVVYSTARRCVLQTLLRSCKARSKRCGQPKFGAGPASLPNWEMKKRHIGIS